jgi:YidC/Oxa1 family membrane protein insertase
LDRNTVTGLLLIFVVFLVWMWYTMPSPEELERQSRERAVRDSLRAVQAEQFDQFDEQITREIELSETDPASALGMFETAAAGDTLLFTVETPKYTAIFTSVGGGPAVMTLQEHRKYDGSLVQLISDTTRSAYSLGFLSTQNYDIETDRLLFRQITPGSGVRIGDGESTTLEYVLEVENGRRLYFTYTFTGSQYEFDIDIRFAGIEDLISGNTFDFAWIPPLVPTERSRKSESMYTGAYFRTGNTISSLLLSSAGTEVENPTGNITWVATKTKFFTQIVKANQETEGALIRGTVIGDPNTEEGILEYSASLRNRIQPGQVSSFRLYAGPLELRHLRSFDDKAYEMVDTGFRFMRWFSDPFVKFVIVPFFGFVGGYVGNYGLVIIIFAFALKIVLYPLTKKSFESMAAMRELQPEMKAIQEKYKDNPQAQQQATMKLFKKAKVNPLGGCLPNLLQMPVLITLWRYFQNSIEIRQESFLWAQDLSAPDPVINLPFAIPFLGDYFGGFVLLMTASMVVQMKISGQSGASNPQMKVFQYVLPVVLLFFFNTLSSGLSLYYLIYNVLSIGQQFMINKKIDHVKLMETVDKKKAREMAREQKLEEKGKTKPETKTKPESKPKPGKKQK